jgi:hypothetical protein
MVCSQCGAENPEGNSFCSSCGATISGNAPASGEAPEFVMPGKLAMMKMMAKADPVLALISVGWMFIVIGAFIPWTSAFGTGILGVNNINGSAVLVVGVLCMVALLLARSGTPGPWNIIIAMLGLLLVALVFQALYVLKDADAPIAGGYWVSMVGVLLIGYGAFKEMRKKPAV